MTDEPGLDLALSGDAAAVAARRDEVAATIRAHAGEVARELSLLGGGDYGRETFETDAGEWTLKYEAGDVEYLRFSPAGGGETYVVSTKQPPEPDALADAAADYPAFVEAYNRHLDAYEGVLDDVPSTFPEVRPVGPLVAERDRIVGRIRDVADAMASRLYRYEGEYGTFARRVSGTRWELKWDGEAASYLRVGGEGGTYLVSQYDPPAATDVRRYADDVAGFVEAFNAFVDELEADLSRVSFDEP
ncbi:hypothetical protein [Salinilacihabitans rarus]|uniref:hypothetical protein n=1 Tax=Salinilacihabitans rarus TaxID=2961596 RepID=UPI0020C93793|nr:hypothetical protein [Salinilacihabitans rarus]